MWGKLKVNINAATCSTERLRELIQAEKDAKRKVISLKSVKSEKV